MTTANITQEVRFAVVLYGGVSLCIYISGVTDELLAMVHATALKADDTPLYPHPKGSAAVYRRIAQYLDTDSTDFALLEQSIPGAPLRTQFIVDVISGTSAGGLNGLFLAKAMARHAGMDGLKKLWLEEGDIQRLLNDSESLQTNGKKEAGLSNPDEPESLLNSQRMYKKLLAVLDTMETSTPEAQEAVKEGNPPKAAAEQIDLYVTTTDLGGLPIKLKLANTVASERRHRSVFHFRYSTQEAGKEQDDFIRANNPFLAFTGRCTSSFPFAFEPMRLIDIEPILENWSDSEGKNPYRPGSGWPNTWEAFYPDYV
ncbi:MAG TPA: patatin-like protein, partial [Chthoniobacter sp.]|nr:patatin-like protein [Chthoniobacter sp.]